MSTIGRPTDYSPEMAQKAWDYLENYNSEHKHAIPSIVGLCRVLNIARSTAYKWAGESDKEFSDILEICKDCQELALLNGGLKNEMNATIVKLALGKHGYHDKRDIRAQVTDYDSMTIDELERELAEAQQRRERSKED